MQTNQLAESLENQEKIPFISTEKELRALKRDKPYRMKCKLCGKEVIKKRPSSKLNIMRHSKFLCQSCGTKQTNLEKYGVENTFQAEQFKKKIKQTNLKKYGVENPSSLKEIRDRVKQTVQQRYNCDNVCQLKEIKEKTIQTNLKKYGVEYIMRSEVFKEKSKQTCLEKYGVEYSSQAEKCKRKCKQTCLEKYGVENTFQAEQFKEKIKQTTLEKYGVESYSQTEECKEKVRQTNLERYGVEYYTQTVEYKEKSKQTSLEHYGTEHPLQSDVIKDKIKQTTLEKYGVENYSQSEECKEKVRQTLFNKYGIYRTLIFKFKYDEISFDSSWELAFYIFHVNQNHNIIRESKPIKYIFNEKEYYYNPDFEIDGQLYEIKGEQFFNEDGTMCNPYDHSLDKLYEAKHQCGIKNNVIFIREKEIQPYLEYMKNNYGTDWKKQFQLKK